MKAANVKYKINLCDNLPAFYLEIIFPFTSEMVWCFPYDLFSWPFDFDDFLKKARAEAESYVGSLRADMLISWHKENLKELHYELKKYVKNIVFK